MKSGRGLQANLTLKIPKKDDSTQAAALLRWEPERWPIAPDWQPVVSRFLSSEPAQGLGRFVQGRLAQGAVIYPPQPFCALKLTALERIKVVILGQDPYHGPGQAQGLAFSVAPGMRLPPSLRNIFKEIARDFVAGKTQIPVNGSLQGWAQQGVLLLNTCMTVEQGKPASHSKQGWEVLTDAIIQAVAASRRPVVFMLWGAHAQTKRDLLVDAAGQRTSLVLTANHPSPLSALRPPQPFIGCGHFGAANTFLVANGVAPVAWA